MAGAIPSGSDPGGFNVDGVDGSIVGAVLGGLAGRTEDVIKGQKAQELQKTPSFTNSSADVFSGLNPNLGMAGAIIKAIIQMVTGIPLQIFGGVGQLLGSFTGIPASQISGKATENLIFNPQFNVDLSGWTSARASSWVWHSDGNAARGCARVNCTGLDESLSSVGVNVSPGNKVTVSVSHRAVAASSSGSPVKLLLDVFDSSDALLATQTMGAAAISSTWATITGAEYTIPSNASYVKLRLNVGAAVVTGAIEFDDASLKKSGLLSQGLVDGLPGILGGFTSKISEFASNFTNIGGTFTSLFNGIVNGANNTNTIGNGINDVFNALLGHRQSIAANTQASTSNGNAITQIVGNLQSVLGVNTNVASSIFDPATAVIKGTVQAATDITNTLANAVKNTTTGGTLQEFLNGFLASDQRNKAALASITSIQTVSAADQSNVPLGGTNKVVNGFVGSDGATPNANDISATGPNSGDLLIRNNNFLGIKAANPTGIYFGTVNGTYTTDDQSLEFILADAGSWNGVGTYGLFHCDAACTVGCYVKVTNEVLTLGTFTRSGSTWTFSPFTNGSVSRAIVGGSRIRVKNVANTFSVDVGRAEALTVPTSGVTFGTGRRSAHVAEERGYSSGFFGFGAAMYDSFRIAGAVMSDYVSTSIVGSGAELARTNTATLQLVKNSTVVFPDNFWQVARNVSQDFIVDVAKGRITSTKSRFITISARVESSGGFVSFSMRAFRGTGNEDPVPDKKIGMSAVPGDGGGFYAYEGTISTYIKAGEYISLGYLSQGGGLANPTINATSDGFSVFMSIVGAG